MSPPRGWLCRGGPPTFAGGAPFGDDPGLCPQCRGSHARQGLLSGAGADTWLACTDADFESPQKRLHHQACSVAAERVVVGGGAGGQHITRTRWGCDGVSLGRAVGGWEGPWLVWRWGCARRREGAGGGLAAGRGGGCGHGGARPRGADGPRVGDTRSAGGTRGCVNREPAESAVLVNGDEVQLGKFRLMFLTMSRNHGGAVGRRHRDVD